MEHLWGQHQTLGTFEIPGESCLGDRLVGRGRGEIDGCLGHGIEYPSQVSHYSCLDFSEGVADSGDSAASLGSTLLGTV